VFKYVHSKGSCFLVDVRVEEMAPSEQFWTSGAMKMYELKLSQRMKMLDMPPESRREQEGTKLVGRPTRSISNWLEKTTEN
jgi:hypothetical protein